MKNPLTLEERAVVGQAFTHDFNGILSVLSNLFNIRRLGKTLSFPMEVEASHLNHLHITSNAVAYLSSPRIEYLSPITENDIRHVRDVISMKGVDNTAFSWDLRVKIQTVPELIQTALYCLARNSSNVADKSQLSIQISANEFNGRIPNLVYRCPIIPESALEGQFLTLLRSLHISDIAYYPTEGHFGVFSVHDNGQGFPRDRPLADFLKPDVSTSGGGFGLYYVTLVCKYLRSHLAIDSQPGNTTVSIYHPLNLT